MKILDEPLTIGAQDLLNGVEYSHRGNLMIFKRKHWKPCYCILSQGCIYFYENWFSKQVFMKKSLKVFENAWEAQGETNERICFYLGYNDETQSLHFCCDTYESKMEWVEKLMHDISIVKSWFYPSGDSGFGSAAGTAVRSAIFEDAGMTYVEVDQRLYQEDQHDPRSKDTGNDYENVTIRHLKVHKDDQHTGRADSKASSYCSVREETDSYHFNRKQMAKDGKIVTSEEDRAVHEDTRMRSDEIVYEEVDQRRFGFHHEGTGSIASSFCSVSEETDSSRCKLLAQKEQSKQNDVMHINGDNKNPKEGQHCHKAKEHHQTVLEELKLKFKTGTHIKGVHPK